MSDNKRIAKNTIFLYIRMFLIMGVGLYTSRVVLQVLGAEDYGLYSVVGGIVTMFSFLNGSLASATSRFITFELGRKNFDNLNKVFNVSLLTHVFLGIGIIILGETIGLWFFYEKMIIPENRLNAAFWVYQISILSSFISLTQVPYNAAIIAHENMKVYSYVGIVEVVLKLIVVFLLLSSPIDKLVYYALLLFAVNVGIILFYRFYCIHNYPESKIKLCKDKYRYKDMFIFIGSDFIGSISVLAQGQGLNLLLNLFFGPIVNAARAIAYTVQGAVTQFGNNFLTAVRPQIIKLYAAGNYQEMFRLVNMSSVFSYYLMWMLILPLSLEAPTMLSLWLGEYPDHTVSFLILIFILCLIQTLKTPRMTVLHATSNIFLANIVVGIILCAAFPFAYILLKMGCSPESVFWSANITMLLSEIAGALVLRKYVVFNVIRYFYDVHFKCLVVSIISFCMSYFIYDCFMDASFLRLVTTCCITTISIVLVVWTIGIDKDMRQTIKSFVRQKLHKTSH